MSCSKEQRESWWGKFKIHWYVCKSQTRGDGEHFSEHIKCYLITFWIVGRSCSAKLIVSIIFIIIMRSYYKYSSRQGKAVPEDLNCPKVNLLASDPIEFQSFHILGMSNLSLSLTKKETPYTAYYL